MQQPTDLPNLGDPEFAPIKARLTRAYLDHKADMGVPNASDESIVSHVDEITAVLMQGIARAVASDNTVFMTRFAWCVEACADIWEGAPNGKLDA
jgi:hypothetical protein